MLKLPKGLKKKKKGKKSKKNQELFTEEELEAYKREQREKQLAEEGTSGKQPNDDEWSKFNALTTGIDTVLKKTQGDLDRIKESSFFQRVPTTSEKKVIKDKQDTEKRQAESDRKEEADAKEAAEAAARSEDHLAQAVIELSESEEESDDADDIFDTAYTDALTSGDVQLAYVPESPVDDVDDGPDPFDTSYADKVIKGPEVSKKGKKLVYIGSAVEVLTGRVEKVTSTTSTARRPRRGPQNLLLESFDDSTGTTSENVTDADVAVQSPVKTLLDDFTDDIPDVPIDLSVSLHIAFQKEKDEQKSHDEEVAQNAVSEFDVLSNDDDDEFAELAAESLTKREDIQTIGAVRPIEFASDPLTATDWAAFDEQKNQTKGKPARPPPPRPANPTVNVAIQPTEESEEESDIDPFDTTFVEKVLPGKDEDGDFDFDPRKDETSVATTTQPSTQVTVVQKQPIDLLSDSNLELDNLTHISIVPTAEGSDQVDDIDPFDTSAVSFIVQPKATEIKFLEKELLSDASLKHSLSDPDFDPRAEETVTEIQIDYQATARRKSSLSLNITGCSSQKSVGFSTDLLGANNAGSAKIQKPLTPYYSQKLIEEKETEDPFDTSFVPKTNPSQVELNLLERDLLQDTGASLHRSLSDPDFDPRAITPIQPPVKSDLLAVNEAHDIKVLTPATSEQRNIAEQSLDSYVDPFDTSTIDHTILPGRAELKLIEDELLPNTEIKPRASVLDSCSDSQELGLGDKVLTPQVPFNAAAEEQDPFDTSIANNLAPGQTEIRLLESELIHQ